jgi:hypothetical protein
MTTKEGISESTIKTASPPKIRWDDSNMRTVYANVCNTTGTREEIVLLFGMNKAWRPGQKEVTVQLTDRIILNPFAAKRLSLLLSNVIQNYERQFGPLDVESRRPADSIIQ